MSDKPTTRRFAVVLERRAAPEGRGRLSKVQALLEQGTSAHADLRAWLDQHAGPDEVHDVSDPNPFGIVFVVGTEEVGEVMRRAPFVQEVSDDVEIPLANAPILKL